MINVTLGAADTQTKKPFPKLMIGRYGVIVFFQENGNGIVISEGDKKEEENTAYVGEISKGWKMQNFTDYNEPITIQNA